ncbi:uncharacterized protein EV422DRAFT_563450 [Fimicolochytrium jonesii]|uniref:uncharacterized protein n=1 Tax=Fimicolochytrium jonesii TaxID=1396493 RepID=UPI0022FE9C13|nr:uncharacterized protein EV422DRAFT_563450 [Fimicolochytrium jonesii]KAI8825619.1 hypothetical protein EV422DRAFT_563450 [Fimicolochytrium jonesii]
MAEIGAGIGEIMAVAGADSTGSLFIPNVYGFNAVQAAILLKVFLPSQLKDTATAAVGVPMMMIGLSQILFVAVPTLLSNTKQYKKPVYIACAVACALTIVATCSSLKLADMAQTDFRQTVAIDFTSMVGFSVVGNPSPYAYTWVYLLSAANVVFELMTILRLRAMLSSENLFGRILFAATILSCLSHLAAAWIPNSYFLARGNEDYNKLEDAFNSLILADAIVTFVLNTMTDWTFIYILLSKMEWNRTILIQIAKSSIVLRYSVNTICAIVCIAQINGPTFYVSLLYTGSRCMWVAWQITTFIQFSFVHTKEIVTAYSASIQGSGRSASQNRSQYKSSAPQTEKSATAKVPGALRAPVVVLKTSSENEEKV